MCEQTEIDIPLNIISKSTQNDVGLQLSKRFYPLSVCIQDQTSANQITESKVTEK